MDKHHVFEAMLTGDGTDNLLIGQVNTFDSPPVKGEQNLCNGTRISHFKMKRWNDSPDADAVLPSSMSDLAEYLSKHPLDTRDGSIDFRFVVKEQNTEKDRIGDLMLHFEIYDVDERKWCELLGGGLKLPKKAGEQRTMDVGGSKLYFPSGARLTIVWKSTEPCKACTQVLGSEHMLKLRYNNMNLHPSIVPT